MEPQIIFENKDLVVLNKPAGLLVHGVYAKGEAKHNEETLVDFLVKKFPEVATVGDKPSERAGIVHRLDRETSGAIIVARNQKTFLDLKKKFQDKTVKKTYVALVWGKVKGESGVINKPISIKDGTVKRTVFKGKMPREAITNYKIINRFRFGKDELTLLEVTPLTGRTHQIRVHLSSIGHPVVGDKLYGKKKDVLGLGRHFLHAQKIEFALPGGKKPRSFSAPLPGELTALLKTLTVPASDSE